MWKRDSHAEMMRQIYIIWALGQKTTRLSDFFWGLFADWQYVDNMGSRFREVAQIPTWTTLDAGSH